MRHERIDDVAKAAAAQHAIKPAAGGDIFVTVSGEVNDDVADLRATEDEPGVAFVADAAIGLKRNARLKQDRLDPVELRQFLLRPIPA